MSKRIETISKQIPQGAVGFVFPVYYCGLPKLVHDFISAINLSFTSYIYAVCTYGSIGGNAGCISQTKKLLKKKGKNIDSAFYIKTEPITCE